jgi:UDP-N-acetylmuramoyl-tripeptide--D-alanyl-D-alanine ligase
MPSFEAAELARWSGGAWTPFYPGDIDGVSSDTRTLEKGNLYFALTGNRFDGHTFVEEAFGKGASGAVVASHWTPSEKAQKLPLLLVEDTSKALRDVAAAYREKLAPKIVAITGSAGKSTVKEMTAQILSTTLPTACTKGNWNNDIGLPLSLLAMESSTRVGVFETGTNHPGELAMLCRLLKPNWGVVTNVGPVHLEFFGSVEAIADEKATLLRRLPSDGVAVLNRDDAFFDYFRSAASGPVLTVSMQRNADYVCRDRNPSSGEATLEETASRETFALKMPLRGEHNIANAMLAIAVARSFGVSWDHIGDAMKNYSSLPMRWQEKRIDGVMLINDAYNANPMSMRSKRKGRNG